MSSTAPFSLSPEFSIAASRMHRELLAMGLLVRRQLEDAIEALARRDGDLAEKVVDQGPGVSRAEICLEQLGIEILQERRREVSQLRWIFGVLRMARNFERIGDHAGNLATRSLKLMSLPEGKEAQLVQPVADLALGLLIQAIAALADQDQKLALQLQSQDEKLDLVYTETMVAYTAMMESGKTHAETGMHLILFLRSLERVGDLTVNLGEDLQFACSELLPASD